jgi:hypothetical protein
VQHMVLEKLPVPAPGVRAQSHGGRPPLVGPVREKGFAVVGGRPIRGAAARRRFAPKCSASWRRSKLYERERRLVSRYLACQCTRPRVPSSSCPRRFANGPDRSAFLQAVRRGRGQRGAASSCDLRYRHHALGCHPHTPWKSDLRQLYASHGPRMGHEWATK